MIVETAVPTMIVETAVPTRDVGTTDREMIVPTMILRTAIPTMIVGTAVPTIIVLTAYNWKSCVWVLCGGDVTGGVSKKISPFFRCSGLFTLQDFQ